LGHALRLVGPPNPKSDGPRGVPPERIERVCRGLYGGRWAYVVSARPVPRRDVVDAADACVREIQAVHAHHKVPGSALGGQNRRADQLVDLLERRNEHLEHGRRVGMWAVRAWLLAAGEDDLRRGRALLVGAFSGDASTPDPIRAYACGPPGLAEPALAWLEAQGGRSAPTLEWLDSTQAAFLACPPREDFPGYEVTDPARFGVAAPAAGPGRLEIGQIIDRGRPTGNPLAIPLADLTRHALIVGVTGSGKTNTASQMLEQLAEAGIPFLVIESAKSEYRGLVGSPHFRDLRIFTCGDETASPLRLNPFEVPPGILVQTHIDYIKSLFSAAFVLYPPMPYVLERSLEEIYRERGWDLVRSTNPRGLRSPRRFPTLTDLVVKVGEIVNRMGYDERLTMDVRAGLVARLDQLRSGGGKGPMLDTRRSVPADVLFGSPCLIELKQVVDDDEKAFLIGLLLIRLYEHHEGRGPDGGAVVDRPRHVTLIEEAHRLLRNVSTEQGGEVAANPKGRAIEVFANILSEVRAYGEAFWIAEQIPVKLVPDAIKNTSLKVVHRLVAVDDRAAVGGTMNLDEAQSRALSTLGPGEAIGYAEGMRRPVRLRVPLSASRSGGPPPSNSRVTEIESVRTFWREHGSLRLPHAGCAHCPASIRGQGCAARGADAANASVREGFTRLFNAIRLDPSLVPSAYREFDARVRRSRRSAIDDSPSYCLFVQLFEEEIERRCRFWGWSYDDIDVLVADACEWISRINDPHRAGEPDALEPEGTRLAGRFRQLHGLAGGSERPFAGCASCESPCQYRFEMQSPSAADAGWSIESALRENNTLAPAADISWRSAAPFFAPDAVADRRGAAICHAAQQLSRQPMSPDGQSGLTRLLATLFASWGVETREDGQR
jgi:hypothetical protein